jgi:hypothetical protein
MQDLPAPGRPFFNPEGIDLQEIGREFEIVGPSCAWPDAAAVRCCRSGYASKMTERVSSACAVQDYA